MKDIYTKDKSAQDGTLRIHRRRAGAYQPKDSLGLSCILQEENDPEESQLLTRRRTLIAPKDNIGISCLPKKNAKSNNSSKEDSESETNKDEYFSPRQDRIKKTEEYLTRLSAGSDSATMSNSTITSTNYNPIVSFKNENSKKQNKEKKKIEIGISNIRRPKGSTTVKPRKPIMPKDNIGSSFTLLQKSTTSKTSIKSAEKKTTDIVERKENLQKSQSTINVKGKHTNNNTISKKVLEVNKRQRIFK